MYIMERYWFINRKFGLGWSPATWEGWLSIVLFVLWSTGVSIRFELLGFPESEVLSQIIAPIFFGVFVLIAISIKTGEPLQWRWGTSTHTTMRLHEEPFLKMQSGEKKVEIRLHDDKRARLKKGDYITFISRQNPDATFKKRVREIATFDSFEQLFDRYPSERTDVYRYYTKKDEQRFGVIAIEME